MSRSPEPQGRAECVGVSERAGYPGVGAQFYVALAVAMACVQWWQIGYRLLLYYRDYDREPFVNHVSDEVFPIIYTVNGLLFVMGAWFVSNFWRTPGRWRWAFVGLTLTNLAAMMAFLWMHRSGALVGYMEFIRHGKAP